jgi:hypothetical protein
MPIVQILEGLLVGNVVGEDNGVRLIDIRLDHLAENTLTANVPDLKRHVQISDKRTPLNKKVYADGLFVALGEVVFTAAHDQTSFAHRAVAEDHHFELKVFRLILAV